MANLLTSVSELSTIGDRVSLLLAILAFAGFAYLAFRAYQIRSIDD